MTKRILVMGLPGSGKTRLAQKLIEQFLSQDISVSWFNADEIREKYNDWDFTYEGRIRQSCRMRELADNCGDKIAICDFVAPLTEMRDNFDAEWTIWVDTIKYGRFEDTNKMFVPPKTYDFHVTEQDAEKWAKFIIIHILEDRRRPVFDWQKETVQMLGRWQPWHDGHRALFERAIVKTGQVIIMIRDCQGWGEGNPFSFDQAKKFIKQDLDPIYQGQYEIILVPNITNITYGRNVGYKVEEEIFDESITSISATKIRNELGL